MTRCLCPNDSLTSALFWSRGSGASNPLPCRPPLPGSWAFWTLFWNCKLQKFWEILSPNYNLQSRRLRWLQLLSKPNNRKIWSTPRFRKPSHPLLERTWSQGWWGLEEVETATWSSAFGRLVWNQLCVQVRISSTASTYQANKKPESITSRP